jgi:hypothetical protein
MNREGCDYMLPREGFLKPERQFMGVARLQPQRDPHLSAQGHSETFDDAIQWIQSTDHWVLTQSIKSF